MASFTDITGRMWSVEIDAGIVREVREQLNVDLVNEESLSFLGFRGSRNESNEAIQQFVDVLFLICEEQCKRLGISDIEFGQSLPADLLPVMKSVITAVSDFKPSWRRLRRR